MIKLPNEDKYKCMQFDLHDSSAQFILYKRTSSWKYKPIYSYAEEVKDFYQKVKAFASKSELDIWCATANIEYELADRILIEEPNTTIDETS